MGPTNIGTINLPFIGFLISQVPDGSISFKDITFLISIVFSNDVVVTNSCSFNATSPYIASKRVGIVMRDGRANGFINISGIVPSAQNGKSHASTIFPQTPF